ncbi:MAG: hypothetical protein WBY94_17210 [Polyangiaceae bacterium]
MPIPFAPLLGVAIGAALAWVAAPELVRDDGPVALSRPFAVVASFAALLWLPIVAYFVGFHGDWAYLYLVPWQRVPSAVDLGFVVLSGAAVVGGFWLSVRPVRKGRLGPVVAMVVAPATLLTLGLALSAHRLAVSGTYAQFHGEFGTEPIEASTLGKGILLMGSLLTLGLAWTVRALVTMAAEA